MGMNACIRGFGPFTEEIIPYLEYPRSSYWYSHCKLGDIIFSNVCLPMPTSESSRELAEMLGLLDCDAGRQIKPENIKAPYDPILYKEDYYDVYCALEDCKPFIAAGWTLFFDPCG